MSRPHARVELRSWVLMAVPMGLLSGGVAGVAVNSVFNGAAPEWVLALAVALATGAGSLANVFSMLWSHWSQGRAKVKALTRLQAALGVCLAAIACAPLDAFGLALTLTAILTAQVLWCGIITVRASIWRVNYTRAPRLRPETRSRYRPAPRPWLPLQALRSTSTLRPTAVDRSARTGRATAGCRALRITGRLAVRRGRLGACAAVCADNIGLDRLPSFESH